jgi:hypothetical protein
MQHVLRVGPGAWDEINAMHREKFGVDPVITGVSFHAGPEKVFQMIWESIERGEPYVEPPVPDGAVI